MVGGAILFEKQQEDKTVTKQEFEALVARGPVLLDGAMGSNLLERGMPKGALSELWADRHPETVLELQAAYAAAGSRILYAPTFQAQPEALAQAGWTGDVGALNARLVALTRRAAGADTLVALDGKALGKPRDREEARAMLAALSGRGIWPPWPDAWSPGTRRISTG